MVHGKNYYPQDLEQVAAKSYDGFQQAGSIAFELNDQLYLAQEIQTKSLRNFDFEQAALAVRNSIYSEFGIVLDQILFTKSGALPKTSSGKVQRARCKLLEESGELVVHHRVIASHDDEEVFRAAANDTELTLTEIWADVLGVDSEQISVNTRFVSLGGSSLMAMRMLHLINQQFEVSLTTSHLFSHPSIAALADLVSQGADQLGQPVAEIPAAPMLKMSAGQQQIWFMEQINPGTRQYVISSAIRLSGQLHKQCLTDAINQIIELNPTLRTCYRSKGEEVVPYLQQDWDFSLSEDSLSGIDSLEDKFSRIINDIHFDLESGLMIKAVLLEVSKQEHVLLLFFHHIAVDGQSLSLINQSLSAIYNGLLAGQIENPLDEKVNFFDFVHFNEQVELGADLGYWENELEGVPSLHNIATNYPREQVYQTKGASFDFELDELLVERLTAKAKELNVSLFVLLYSVFGLLVHRLSGDEKTVIGVPFSGRTHPQSQDLVGMFVNPLPMVMDFSTVKTFDKLLSNAQKSVATTLSNQHVPFSTLVEKFAQTRNAAYHPIFQIMFAYVEADSFVPELSDLECEEITLPRDTARFDLTLEVIKEANKTKLVWEYAAELYSHSRIESWADSYLCMLNAVCDESAQPISSLPLHSNDVVQAIIEQGRGERVGLHERPLVIEKIEEIVARFPDSKALTFGDDSLTYAQLDQRANQLAHHILGNSGAAPKTIAVCLERSMDVVVSILACFKAGATYVPIEPSFPVARIDRIIEQAGCDMIVSQSMYTSLFSSDIEVFVVDEEASWSNLVATKPCVDLERQATAYIMFTSGSTGVPKGVSVSHENLINFFAGLDAELGSKGALACTQRQNNWLAVTSVCFDISILELVWVLTRAEHIVVQANKPVVHSTAATSDLDFSLFYFASDVQQSNDQFNLLLEGAKFADAHGLSAVWVPERHFHPFGGQFSNPSVAAAAVAASTEKVGIRSGSIVLPLHDPLRVAEEWSMVDNLSQGGRIGLSVAPGWQPNDFVLSPESYHNRHQVMRDNLEELKKLWDGKQVERVNGEGNVQSLKVYPKPVSAKLPIWVTIAGSADSFAYAGSIGANVLTHFLGQSPEELASKITIYREALSENGYDPEQGIVSLMIHTYLHHDQEKVMSTVEKPFKDYLRSSLGLIAPVAKELGLDLVTDEAQIVDTAYKRYFNTSSLFGSPEICLEKVKELSALGVNEIACLIDFGIDEEKVLESLPLIAELQSTYKRMNAQQQQLRLREDNEFEPNSLIAKHKITHLQCTPAFAAQLDEDSLSTLKALFVGGDAMTPRLVSNLKQNMKGDLFNMYGPTEATVWTSVQHVEQHETFIAKPMVNTDYLILDSNQQIVPVGELGELYIGGLSVTSGYINAPQKQQEHFVKLVIDDAIWYRTGDLVSWDNECGIQFHGRVDNQVKVNGHRIELGEIESALELHSDVEEAIVLQTGEHKDLLCAFVTSRSSEDSLDEGMLKAHVGNHVPSYMLPQKFVVLEALPTNSNGKVDRNALSLHAEKLQTDTISAPPQSTSEKQLHTIWCELLNRSSIDINSSFFDVGGHSLLATRLAKKIEEQLDITMEVKVLFQYTSIAEQAQYIDLSKDMSSTDDSLEYTVNLTI
ncbi:MupA/Atu3671 family FMN-dependent luciferase-like monooxygenase [Pseudoalteromonas luteoviolacea]|uniref:MupA/Atu3671 family FMN-dependent luciferase-like monooxygenase n=1 Tax=Pseudoalteromonas luteoviolacea TaxID=43657 RepID=UPI003F806614